MHKASFYCSSVGLVSTLFEHKQLRPVADFSSSGFAFIFLPSHLLPHASRLAYCLLPIAKSRSGPVETRPP